MVLANNAMKLRGVQIDIIDVLFNVHQVSLSTMSRVLEKKTSHKITVSSASSAEFSEDQTAAPCAYGSMYFTLRGHTVC